MSDIIKQGNQTLQGISSSQIQKLLAESQNRPVKTNPYTAQITRETPSAFLFMIDQSGSMANQLVYNGVTMTQADAVAKIINKLFYDLINRCKKSEGIRDYFDIALIGYGGKSAFDANLLWEGPLEGREWVKVSELDQNYLSKEEVILTKTIRGVQKTSKEEVKVWLKPLAKYRTPMKPALTLAHQLLERWMAMNSSSVCFPPIVINITDGAATDTTVEEISHEANKIKQLHTPDGHVLFLNIHISNSSTQSVIFPQQLSDLPANEYARLLYDLSSELPLTFNQEIANIKQSDVSTKYIGMAYNADTSSLIQILNIGTATSKGII